MEEGPRPAEHTLQGRPSPQIPGADVPIIPNLGGYNTVNPRTAVDAGLPDNFQTTAITQIKSLELAVIKRAREL